MRTPSVCPNIVSRYTRADGTHINGYWRSAGQRAATDGGGTTIGGGSAIDDSGWARGMRKQQSDDPKTASGYVYKDVMTDVDLAACRH